MIKLSRPSIGSEEIEEVKKVLESKNLVQGEKVAQLEAMLSCYLNIKYCIAVSNGTAALHLSLLALNIKSGDEVIVPDFTFPATANAVELTGAKVKFVDIRPDSFCIDSDKIEEAITDKTRAIIPVHEFGQCADMNKIMDLAEKYKLKVIEDGACALGALYDGKQAGTIGHIGCFSFHPRKAITTGEGGLIATCDEELAQSIRALRNHGISSINGNIDFIAAGFNYRMTDIQAAIGIAQMKKLDESIRLRRDMAKEYNRLLSSSTNIVLPVEKAYGKHIYQTYHILVNEKFDRNYIKERLLTKGIECNIGAYAVHEQTYYKKKYNFDSKLFFNSLSAFEQGLALPLHGELTYENLNYISDEIKSILGS